MRPSFAGILFDYAAGTVIPIAPVVLFYHVLLSDGAAWKVLLRFSRLVLGRDELIFAALSAIVHAAMYTGSQV